MNGGWIKIHRKLLEWEWYDDVPTKVVWLHLLLTANWEDKEWHGITIARGQRIYSRFTLAKETNLSQKQVRTAISHLLSTGEITVSSSRCGSIVTLVKYEEYQTANTNQTGANQRANQRANEGANQEGGKTAGIFVVENSEGPTEGPTEGPAEGPVHKNIRNKEIKNISSSSSLSLNTTNYIEDEDAKAVFSEWDKARCCLSSQAEWERIGNLYDQYGKEAMLRAIRAAVDHGAVSIAYIKAVLRGKNYDLTEEEKRQNMREWLNG